MFLGPVKVVSGNILVSKSYNFFNAFVFCQFLNLNNSSRVTENFANFLTS